MQSLFYNKELNISCKLLNTVLKVRNRTVLGIHVCTAVEWWSCTPSANICKHFVLQTALFSFTWQSVLDIFPCQWIFTSIC
jgi:hypothetical protein